MYIYIHIQHTYIYMHICAYTVNTSSFVRCSGLSQAHTRTLPEESAEATQKPLGENLATVVGKAWPL
jgi:hypothetical protein